MGSALGEIRVGPSHQAKLPENRTNIDSSELSADKEFLQEREEVRWTPSVAVDDDLVTFLQAARSMAAFARMCDGGSSEDGLTAANSDETTFNALDVLHNCDYDKSKALQTLVKCPVPKSIEKRLTEEEIKRFIKGLRQFGKNFLRIKKDLLPHKETPELVEFFYLWKKSPEANYFKPHRRRRQGALRRNRNMRNTRAGAQKEEVAGNSRPSPGPKDQMDASSGSDEDNSFDDYDSRENGGYQCQNCFITTSRDWLHAASDSKPDHLLCHSCHTYYKQCGELPQTTKTESYSSQSEHVDLSEDSPGRMRTRNKTKETPTKEKSKSRHSETTTFESETEKKSESRTCASKSKKGKTDNVTTRKRLATSPPAEDEAKRVKREPDSVFEESDAESDDIGATVSSAGPQNVDANQPTWSRPATPPFRDEFETQEPCVATADDRTADKTTSRTNESPGDAENCATPDVPYASFRPFDYADETVACKSEPGIKRDEAAAPVSSGDECYVAKDEMSTSPVDTTSACVPETMCARPQDAAVKTERSDETRKSNDFEISRQSPSAHANETVSAYDRIAAELPASGAETDADKPSVEQPLLATRYPPYGAVDDAKNAKELPSIPLAASDQATSYSPYYHYPPNFPVRVDKSDDNGCAGGELALQMEPQDLKIRQEHASSFDQQRPPPLAVDPLQSLKHVKVPGYANVPISQSSANPPADLRTMANRSKGSSPFAVPADEMANKESAAAAAKVGVDLIAQSSAQSPKLSATSPYPPPHTSRSRTPMLSPGGAAALQPSPLNQASAAHLSPHSQAYGPAALHSHQQAAAAAAAVAAYYQHPLFAQVAHAAAMHQFPHPHYAGYPYGFPYPTPYPIPQPIPPARASAEGQKREGERSSTASHHSSSSSRSLRDDESNVPPPEVTQTPHRHSSSSSSSSHHASVHHANEKKTHLSGSSSSAQHKVKRTSSPQHSSSTCHVSATLSSSSANHGPSTHHGHHQQHTASHHHRTAESPSPLTNMSMPLAPPNKTHPGMLTGPPVLPLAHHSALSMAGLALPATGSLEALRAHAHAIHSPLRPPSSHEDDGIHSPLNYVPKGPSPEPKIEDSECHRSQSAIFLRHWNRGDFNSCARTDLTFKPVPESKLDKKRQEQKRKRTEKEREEREKSQTRKAATPDKAAEAAKPPSRGAVEPITSPYDRFARVTPYGDATPALRQLSEYARPHAGFSPVGLPRSAAAPLGIPPQCIDPMLQYQLYGPSPRERLELEHFEREKRDRELREMREERLKEEMIKAAGTRLSNPMDAAHWMDLRRFNSLTPAAAAGNLHPFGLYAGASQPGTLSPLERQRLERLATAAGPYPRPGLMAGREAALAFHPSADLLMARPYADQLAHQAAAHEHMQRQMLLERERYSHPALVAAQQQEEYLRKLSLGNQMM